MKVRSESEVTQSCPTLATPWTAAHQAPPSMGFSRQEYWSGVPLPSPEIGHYLTPNTKINSKCIKHLRPETIKTPKKKTGDKLPDVGIGKDFWI